MAKLATQVLSTLKVELSGVLSIKQWFLGYVNSNRRVE